MTTNQERVTASKILKKTLEQIAPLPSQRGYAEALAGILSMHIHRNLLIDEGIPADELPAPSAIVVAPTGQGKTYLFRKMAEALGLNTITIDCSTLSAEGWKGVSLSQRIGAARDSAKDDQPFSQSIFFLDEIDKLKNWGTHYDQGSAMPNILQLFNGGAVTAEVRTKMGTKTVDIDISRFTILLGGAFEGLDSIIRDRIGGKNQIGFGSVETTHDAKLTTGELLQQATLQDLEKYGLMMELLGRIGTVLSIPPLEMEDYRQLLCAEQGSLRCKYRNYLQNLYGVEFEISDVGVEQIAKQCMRSSAGARAVNPLINDAMRAAIMAVEDDDSICKVILDATESGCVARYEHGMREYSFFNAVRQKPTGELTLLLVRANTLMSLVRKLMRYYRNAGGDSFTIPELEPFLECAIMYLETECRPADFCFESLEKLARATLREGDASPFEIILKNAVGTLTKQRIQRFKDAYTHRTTHRLVSALRSIMTYIRAHHGERKVVFQVKHTNSWRRQT